MAELDLVAHDRSGWDALWLYLGRLASVLYFGALIGLFGWVVAQVLDRSLPVDVSAWHVVSQGAVLPGQDLFVEWTVDRHRSCDTTMRWTVIDGDGVLWPHEPMKLGIVGNPGSDTFTRTFKVPSHAEDGAAKLRIAISYECRGNFVHAIWPLTKVLPDIPFTIADASAHDHGPGPRPTPR